MSTNDNAQQKLLAELLCVADTDWVLGHWFLKTMMNGRSLTDCTAFAGMAQDTLGHTRAVFQMLEDWHDMPEQQLEFSRGADKIHNMQALDNPPESWGDFVLTTFLVGAASWRFLCTFKAGNNEALEGMVEHIGTESYFHRMNITGWLKELTEEEIKDLATALPNRLPQVLAWFGSQEAAENDILLKEGVRSASTWEARQSFIEEVTNKLIDILSLDDKLVTDIISSTNGNVADNDRRREEGTEIPASMWEFMVPTSAEAIASRRPLSVSITDNIDLFERDASE